MRGRLDEIPDSSPVAVFLRRYGLIVLWLLLAWAMWRSWQHDPYNPAFTGTAAYGHNRQGALLQGIGYTGAELVITYVALRAWSRQGSWWRAVGGLLGFGLFAPIAAVGVLASIHAGGIGFLHVFWLVVLSLVLGVTTLVSLVGRYISWRHRREQAAPTRACSRRGRRGAGRRSGGALLERL
jgi:hypothetical protein